MSEVLFRGLLGCFEVGAAVERVQVVTMTGTRWSFAEGTVGASPVYFPFDARRQSRSCRLLARVAIRWHVPSWLLRLFSFFFAALGFMSVARMAGGAHVICVGLYRF